MKWNIGWGCVSACNMRCEFCYSKHRRIIYDDLSLTDWKRFIDENGPFIETINYGTGENSLSDEWFLLIDYIRKTFPEIRQALTTNGHIYEATARNEKKKNIFLSSIDEVDVSLDFADRNLHNAFRGQPKAYDWACDTMQLCKDYGIPLTIVTLGSEKNLYDENVDGIFEIANRFDSIVRINIYRPTTGIHEISNAFILKPETLLRFLRRASEKYAVLSINDALLSPILTGKASADPSGRASLRILPNGDVTPSTYLISQDFVLGNLRTGFSLKELSDNEVLAAKMRTVIPKECQECEYVTMCEGGVVDRRYLWNKSLERKDPYCFLDHPELAGQYDFRIKLSEEHFTSVHDGYLPTMFFKNQHDK